MKEDRSQHFSGNFCIKAIIVNDNKVLVCKGIGDKVWELPGGRLHQDEEPEVGLRREIKEELGIDIVVGNPVHICRSYHVKNDVWQLIAAYKCTPTNDQEIAASDDEVEEYMWVGDGELKVLPMFDECRELVDRWVSSF